MTAVATPLPMIAVPRGATLDGFFRNLRASKLLPDNQVEQLALHFGSRPLEEVTALLLEEQCLTPYQLKRVIGGKTTGLVMGPYRIVDELGSGAFGIVYKAVHSMMDRMVALKAISPEFVRDPDIRQLFVREAQATHRLVHPNIAALYDADCHEEQIYLAMEYVDGTDLDTFVQRKGKLPFSAATSMLWQVVQALSYAHSFGIVHRDIKPANLMVTRASADNAAAASGLTERSKKPIVKIIDFGFARLFPRNTPKAQSINARGSLVGTPEFMAPEQARDVHDADIRSDIYSLGCTFYYVMSGVLPFSGDGPVDTLMAHLETTPQPLSAICPEIPGPVSAIVRRMMASDPKTRHQTTEELAEEMTFAFGRLLGEKKSPSLEASGFSSLASPESAVMPPEESPVSSPESSASRDADPIAEDLSDVWKDWVDCVNDILENPTRGHDKDFLPLRNSLLETIAGGGAGRYSCRMQALVEPLVSVEAVSRLDSATRTQFASACRDVTNALQPTPPRPSRTLELVALMLLIAGLATSSLGTSFLSRLLTAVNIPILRSGK